MGECSGAYYSDEYRDFLEFKKRTGGVMYQHQEIKVTEYNQDEVAKQLPEQFKVIAHTKTVPDKRRKEGERTVTTYTYEYWGKEYKSLAELNKHGVYITVEVHFDSILDIIPYYPYLVTASCSNGDRETVFISKQSFVISERDEHYRNGWISNSWQWYNKKLQEHYFEVCRDYLCYKLEERTKVVPIDLDHMECPVEWQEGDPGEPGEKGNYHFWVWDDIIDCNHPVEFVWEDGKMHPHWSAPKQIGDSEISISWQNIEQYLKEDIKNGTVKIKYVAVPKGGFPLRLG